MKTITINPLKVAEELAHQAVRDELLEPDETNESDLYYTFRGADNKIKKSYIKIAQDCYNRHIDYFMEILTNNSITTT